MNISVNNTIDHVKKRRKKGGKMEEKWRKNGGKKLKCRL